MRDPRLTPGDWEEAREEAREISFTCSDVTIYDKHGHMVPVDQVAWELYRDGQCNLETDTTALLGLLLLCSLLYWINVVSRIIYMSMYNFIILFRDCWREKMPSSIFPGRSRTG